MSHPQTTYTETLNWLLQAQHAFSHGNPALGMSCLVKAEQLIPEIDGALQFLQCQNTADKIWKEYLLESELDGKSCVRELRVQNNWQVA